ncbi:MULTISPECIES: ROK family transcriptional regulator [unclassified Rhodococcus (in: high G+C Gram-positive bacteria)]|uniref:ROK family transcriptional regulator n=1 Tax=unclassified Rhodococcus (in: high G+C Gram-positive bacteria) TaxID=192944 RepID=UPI00163A6652|nr:MULTISPECIES: ROK family transcriptional regulator [unclassified Rhodococcus (in: high G+C Gram-positive bacteria)]MBC2642321.1 ROK family transcriptional regulator [Rhodococcus sp. 3A]MBC2892936.1 ROK family transcriptional regulator [Rhodococcus sp. 4CII]
MRDSDNGDPPRPGSQSSLKSANQHRVVRALQTSGELTQAEIARRTGLAPATVSNMVKELTAAGMVAVPDGDHPGQRGRAVRLTRKMGLAVGIDFGHRHLTVAVADMAHQVLAEERVELGPGHRAEDGVVQAGTLLDAALDRLGCDRTSVLAVGMGLPAPLETDTGEVGGPSILPGWVGVDAAAIASEYLGTAVHVDNDANLGVLAEHMWGAGRGTTDLAYIKLSDGVGAGLVLDGRLYRGRGGTAGEIGHLTLDEFGQVCRCGNRGCLETLVASHVVIRLLEPSRGPDLTIADIVAMAEGGDAACIRVLADTGRHVGIAAASLCNLVNPERLVIGGELALAGELLLGPMREVVGRYAVPSAVRALDIRVAELGPRAQVLGAVALGLRSALPA